MQFKTALVILSGTVLGHPVVSRPSPPIAALLSLSIVTLKAFLLELKSRKGGKAEKVGKAGKGGKRWKSRIWLCN